MNWNKFTLLPFQTDWTEKTESDTGTHYCAAPLPPYLWEHLNQTIFIVFLHRTISAIATNVFTMRTTEGKKTVPGCGTDVTLLPGVGYSVGCAWVQVCLSVCERWRDWKQERRVQLSHFVKGDFAVAVVTLPCACLSLYTPQNASLADTSSLSRSWTFVKIYINI